MAKLREAFNDGIHPVPPPLPPKIDDWTRHLKAERTLNDLVEDIHRLLVEESEEYREFLRAVYDGQAKEGSLTADDHEAARMIRDKAKELNTEVAKEKIGPIKHALIIVLRRYHMTRKQRRNMVQGEEVPTDEGSVNSNGTN